MGQHDTPTNENYTSRFIATHCGQYSVYEGCSNMNASSFITFVTYTLRQNGKRLYKILYVTFKLAPNLKKNKVILSTYSPLNEGNFSILTNSMLRTYTSDIVFDKSVKFLAFLRKYPHILIL